MQKLSGLNIEAIIKGKSSLGNYINNIDFLPSLGNYINNIECLPSLKHNIIGNNRYLSGGFNLYRYGYGKSSNIEIASFMDAIQIELPGKNYNIRYGKKNIEFGCKVITVGIYKYFLYNLNINLKI